MQKTNNIVNQTKQATMDEIERLNSLLNKRTFGKVVELVNCLTNS